MKKTSIAILAALAFAAAAGQKRIITLCADSPFAFDPVSDKYARGSLAAAATYVEAWREELGEGNVEVRMKRGESGHTDGYGLYNDLCDTTFFRRIYRWFGIGKPVQVADSIPRGAVLVADISAAGDTVVKIVDIVGFGNSKNYTDHFREDIMAVKRFFVAPVAELAGAVSTRDSYFGPSAFDALFNTFQHEAAGADISFFAPPRFDTSLAGGNIYVKDIFDLFGYDNTLVSLRVKGSLIREFLEEVYASRYYIMRSPTDDLLRVRTPYYLHDSPAGLSFRVNLTKKKGRRIESLKLADGREFDPNALYCVSLNSFRAKYFTDRGCAVVQDHGDYKRALIKWLLSKENPLPDCEKADWKLIPERWAEEASEREKALVF